MYTGPLLIELLEKQHQAREAKLLPSGELQSGLFRKDTFTLQWRAKVGSFPHRDRETIVSAGEPSGAWQPRHDRKEDIRERSRYLPLNGYIPGSSIRGIVRAWAKQRPEIRSRMYKLLGYQDNDTISAGKIEFLDAWPDEATQLALDIVNPQEDFQVYHNGKPKPLALYTLGNGNESIAVTVAIRGIPGRATEQEVEEVWGWVQQALSLYGVGSRTASGYGTVKANNAPKLALDPGYKVMQFEFSLKSQGCYGPTTDKVELRPSHWRGWLRSWVLRFLLGVMSKPDAQTTVGELLGSLGSEPDKKSRKGCVRMRLVKGRTWADCSEDRPYFYTWEGKLEVSAPSEILNKIILPIIRIAVMVGGVGRGWRRPLHIFHMNNGREAARGTYLTLKHKIRKPGSTQTEIKLYSLPLKSANWMQAYQDWLEAARCQWPERVISTPLHSAEVFSPQTCAVYAVPGPVEEPLARSELSWQEQIDAQSTRGAGMELIYQPTYKRKQDVGGDAAGAGGNSHCSWVTIKRVNIPNQQQDTDCQEIVCLFMGEQTPQSNHLRSSFLIDLDKMVQTKDALHLFGVKPSTQI